MIREAIQQLVGGEDLERDQATGAMDEIMNGEATGAQIAGFLLGVRPVSTYLGPPANPALVRRQALGVGSAEPAGRMVQVLSALGHQRALVFHSEDGLDELSTVAPSHVFELRDGKIPEYEVDPGGLGVAP